MSKQTPRRSALSRFDTAGIGRNYRQASAFLDFLDFRVNHIVVCRLCSACSCPRAGASPSRTAPCTGFLCGLFGLHVGIHFFAQLLADGHQCVAFFFDRGLIVAFEYFFELFDRKFDLFFLARIELVAVFCETFLDAVQA